MNPTQHKTILNKKRQQEEQIAKSRPTKEELEKVTKKAINQYRQAIKNLARR